MNNSTFEKFRFLLSSLHFVRYTDSKYPIESGFMVKVTESKEDKSLTYSVKGMFFDTSVIEGEGKSFDDAVSDLMQKVLVRAESQLVEHLRWEKVKKEDAEKCRGLLETLKSFL